MNQFYVQAGRISGQARVPPSKSHSIRAILFASMAQGRSHIESYLNSPDIMAMINACRAFGARIHLNGPSLEIEGVDASPKVMDQVIDAGNSGQVLRFIGAIAGLIDGYTIITGDHSLRYQRPIAPLISGLNQLGCFAVSAKEDAYAPLIVRGRMRGGDISIDGMDSQPVSGLLMASCFADKPTRIQVSNSGELPWIELSLSWLDKLGLSYQAQLGQEYWVAGNQGISGFDYQVAGDFSSAAFLLVAAAISQTNISLRHLDLDDVQGDKGIVNLLQALGFKFEFNSCEMVFLGEDTSFSGFDLDINAMIDALPILAVLACFAQSSSYLRGAAIARKKESDRISVIAQELRKMGAEIKELEDGLEISPRPLKACSNLQSHADHRIAMALAVAAMAAEGNSLIHGVACVEKSFPNFVETLRSLGGKIAAK